MNPDELDEWLLPLCMPLCPLRRPEEEKHYIDVDHLKDLFAEFQKLFPTPAQRPDFGHFIVVDGDKGAGKTSLIFRCVHWLQSQSGQDDFTVVNLLDMPYPPKWRPGEMVLPVFRRILSEAQLEQGDVDALGKQAETDLPLAFKGLMMKHPGTLAVLLAPGPTADEIEEFAGAVAGGMVFIVEQRNPEAGEACMQRLNRLRQSGYPLVIKKLSAGKLLPGDGQRMVDGIDFLRSANMPPIPAQVVSQAFQPEGTGLHGILYYKRLALGSAKLAEVRSSAEVEFGDVLRYLEFFIGQTTQGGQ